MTIDQIYEQLSNLRQLESYSEEEEQRLICELRKLQYKEAEEMERRFDAQRSVSSAEIKRLITDADKLIKRYSKKEKPC